MHSRLASFSTCFGWMDLGGELNQVKGGTDVERLEEAAQNQEDYIKGVLLN